jgi:hypothetical protein
MKWTKVALPGWAGSLAASMYLSTAVPVAVPISDEKCSTTNRFPGGTV